MRLVSPNSVFALAQSGRTLNRIQIASITVPTSSGGLLNTLISAMSFLSKASKAYKSTCKLKQFKPILKSRGANPVPPQALIEPRRVKTAIADSCPMSCAITQSIQINALLLCGV